MTRVETVKGSVLPDELGVTSCHEHVFLNILNWLVRPQEASKLKLLESRVSMDVLGELRRDALSCKDNLVLSDEQLAAQEVLEFKRWGGKTIVEVTLPLIGRDPLALKRISEQIGINIVTGTGWYVHGTHPPVVREKGVEALSEIIVGELTEEIDGTGVKAGVIGEIGCSVPHHPYEQKVLKAAAKAQAKTGAGMTIHPGIYDFGKKVMAKEALKYLDMVEGTGGDLNKVYLSHADFTLFDLEYHKKLLDRGITLSYDEFGQEYGVDSFWPGAGTPSDRERIEAVVGLCKQGYDRQLLLSHDICLKLHLTKYGGYGYGHVLKNIVPMLRFRGVSAKQIKNMLIENPKRILAF